MKSLALLLSLAATGTALAGIAGTAHDLSARNFVGPSADQICIYCHTPHNATAAAPLWNRNNSVATYTMYTSPTMNAAAPTTADGSSVLCLSCHDGTIALNSLHNSYGWGGTETFIANWANVNRGTESLSNDHPISITYPTTDAGLYAPDSQTVAPLLQSGKVQCTSCHDVHSDTYSPFLVMSNTGSALCLTCHNK